MSLGKNRTPKIVAVVAAIAALPPKFFGYLKQRGKNRSTGLLSKAGYDYIGFIRAVVNNGVVQYEVSQGNRRGTDENGECMVGWQQINTTTLTSSPDNDIAIYELPLDDLVVAALAPTVASLLPACGQWVEDRNASGNQ